MSTQTGPRLTIIGTCEGCEHLRHVERRYDGDEHTYRITVCAHEKAQRNNAGEPMAMHDSGGPNRRTPPTCPELPAARLALARGIVEPHGSSDDVPPLPPLGFAGRRVAPIAIARDGAHTVTLARYAFDDGSLVPYVELRETHDGSRPGRVMALSTLVHLAQNVGDDEIWEIGNRDVLADIVGPARAASVGERCGPVPVWCRACAGGNATMSRADTADECSAARGAGESEE